jgi:hypothetical protein
MRRIAAIAIVTNPYAGRYVEDLSEAMSASIAVGEVLSKLAVDAMGPFKVESYGRADWSGSAANWSTPMPCSRPCSRRRCVRRSAAPRQWIPSFTKLAAPGCLIDVPLAHKDALYVRSHYDGVSVALPPDAPAADEVALIVCLANRGRLNARVGGLAANAIVGKDGLR